MPPQNDGSASIAAAPVLLVTELYPPAVGGSAVLFANIYSRLTGPSVTVLADDRLGPEDGPAPLPVVRRPLRTPWWGLDPRGLLHHIRTAFTIRRMATRMPAKPVVHCGRILPEGMFARLAQLGGGPRFVCWTHGEDLAFMAKSRELTAAMNWVLGGASAVVANSENTKSYLVRAGVRPEQVTVVYPGVNLSRFRPDIDGSAIRARHGLEGRFVLLSVGRLQARKGHDVAIQAVAALRDQLPTLTYVIVGSGEERARLDALVASLAIGDRVIFAGEAEDATLPHYYAACDVFLLANRVEQGDFEGFGIVFLEASASGKPVIGGASGGVVEAVAHGVTGTLVDGSNVAQVADAILALAQSPELRRAYGEAGRRRAVEQFAWEVAGARVTTLHRALSS